MTAKLFTALYVGMIVGTVLLFFFNFDVAWIFFGFLMTFGMFIALFLTDRPYLIAGAFLLVSAIVMGVGVNAMQQSIRASNWPTTTGAITRSMICTRWVNGSTNYTGPCIDYTYRANELEYRASSIDTGEFTNLGAWWSIAGIPAQYRQDRAVTVHYDPTNPGISRLDPSIPLRDWMSTIIGGAMAALSAVTLWWTVFKPAKKDPSLAHSKVAQLAKTVRGQSVSRPSQAKTRRDVGDQLEKLAHLHEKGELTDEEYELAKKKLLGP